MQLGRVELGSRRHEALDGCQIGVDLGRLTGHCARILVEGEEVERKVVGDDVVEVRSDPISAIRRGETSYDRIGISLSKSVGAVFVEIEVVIHRPSEECASEVGFVPDLVIPNRFIRLLEVGGVGVEDLLPARETRRLATPITPDL